MPRNCKELWVKLRGEARIAVLDVELGKRQAADESVDAVRRSKQRRPDVAYSELVAPAARSDNAGECGIGAGRPSAWA